MNCTYITHALGQPQLDISVRFALRCKMPAICPASPTKLTTTGSQTDQPRHLTASPGSHLTTAFNSSRFDRSLSAYSIEKL